MKKPARVSFARQKFESVEALEKRLAAIDAMQRQLRGETAKKDDYLETTHAAKSARRFRLV
jgi:hypothetical protein